MVRRRREVPLLFEPSSVSDAVAHGVGRGRMRSPALEHPFWGVVQERGRGEEDPFLRRCLQAAARMPAYQFFSHGTALRLRGAPALTANPDEIHISAYRPRREPRRSGIHGHRLQLREDGTDVIGGLRVEHPARAWQQAARTWSTFALVAAGDFLVARRRPLVTLEQLRTEVVILGGSPAAHAALELIRDGSESPRETQLRLLLVGAGLPEPELNVDLVGSRGRTVARLDMFYRRFRVAVEYDGRQHALSAAQFERDSDRWDDIRAEGVELVRVLHHHMAGDGRAAVLKVRNALLRAGWRPGRA